ncbi:MAG: non-hydrolyzing UDP-N-acetylglucosamine 2-epimerase [Candidatus Hermodarchaeia archaeon]|jgi:UDP-N-acetylglucosamine 2-epimerase (non-hydrolysing)
MISDFGTLTKNTRGKLTLPESCGENRLRVVNVVGARPNLMKIAALVHEMKRYPEIEYILVHTGQHYDRKMSSVFFDELDIPEPDVYIGVGSGSHAEQSAKVMLAFEPLLIQEKPDVVLVVGDVNSTLACALVAAKLHVPVAHVEAGLRSFDRTMPEEINRVLTDQLADHLFTTEEAANDNLVREGIPTSKIHFVGNTMIDTLFKHKEKALALRVFEEVGFSRGGYAVLTLHRPSNVDEPDVLSDILEALSELQDLVPVAFPAHPRTLKRIKEFGFEGKFQSMEAVEMIEPLGYLEFLSLVMNARLVLTDSGGIQEETTFLTVPCLTLRENTERPVTISKGTNTLVGNDPKKIVTEAARILNEGGKASSMPELWDGHAAERIVKKLLEEVCL